MPSRPGECRRAEIVGAATAVTGHAVAAEPARAQAPDAQIRRAVGDENPDRAADPIAAIAPRRAEDPVAARTRKGVTARTADARRLEVRIGDQRVSVGTANVDERDAAGAKAALAARAVEADAAVAAGRARIEQDAERPRVDIVDDGLRRAADPGAALAADAIAAARAALAVGVAGDGAGRTDRGREFDRSIAAATGAAVAARSDTGQRRAGGRAGEIPAIAAQAERIGGDVAGRQVARGQPNDRVAANAIAAPARVADDAVEREITAAVAAHAGGKGAYRGCCYRRGAVEVDQRGAPLAVAAVAAIGRIRGVIVVARRAYPADARRGGGDAGRGQRAAEQIDRGAAAGGIAAGLAGPARRDGRRADGRRGQRAAGLHDRRIARAGGAAVPRRAAIAEAAIAAECARVGKNGGERGVDRVDLDRRVAAGAGPAVAAEAVAAAIAAKARGEAADRAGHARRCR